MSKLLKSFINKFSGVPEGLLKDVLVFGSINVDFFCYVDRLPKPGETIHGTKFTTGFGGKGANQCVAAARLGAKCAMVGRVGTDSWGQDYLKQLDTEGVDLEYVKQCEGESTGVAQIAISKEGENNIIIVVGANNCLGEAAVREAQPLFDNTKVLLCQLETPWKGTLEALKSFKGISILNAAPGMVDMPVSLLQAANILCVNETEAAILTKGDEVNTLDQAKAAIQMLLDMGSSIVIITLGSQGVVYAEKENGNDCFYVPAHKAEKVVDTTGAGDAFLGALAYHMAQCPEEPLHQHVGFANVQAAFSVQIPGTQTSFPYAHDIQTKEGEYFYQKI